MPTDYMDAEAEPTTADEGGEPTEETKPEEKAEESNEGTALINKSIAPNAKAGDTVTFKVVHVYEDELAVEPSSAKSDKTEEPDDLEPAEKENAYMD